MAYYMNKNVPAKRGDIFYISNSKCYATDLSNAEVLCKIPSTALCETIYTVNKDRLGDFVRTCTDKEMEGVNAGILCSLGIAAPVVEGETVDNSVTVERNLYKHLYEDLLNKVMAR